MAQNRFLERLARDGPILCGEGYLFEMERRGYVQVGPFVPTVVLEHPSAVEELHREYLRAGSDIIEAFTYYAHREKLKIVNQEEKLEELNRNAIRLAKKVALEGDALVAGNICNTNVYDPTNQQSIDESREMFEEQVKWAAEEGVDLVIGETFHHLGEALLALEVIKKYSLPAVITYAIHRDPVSFRDGYSIEEGTAKLFEAGADVVGINCARGPQTILPLVERLVKALPGRPIAALPVGYRTTEEKPTMQSLESLDVLYTALDPHTCTRYDMYEFGLKCKEIGVKYVGVCCGGAPHHLRAIAEAFGRRPPASAYSPDLSKHIFVGTHPSLRSVETSYKDKI